MKKTVKTNSSKYMIVGFALALATLGYFGYKNLLTKPDINKIDDGGNSNGDKNVKNNNQLNTRNPNQEKTPQYNSKTLQLKETIKLEKLPNTKNKNIIPKDPNPGK